MPKVLVLNLVLAVTFSLLAPDEPKLNDRQAYDYIGRSPLSANCPFSIYCYRPLAPVMVHALPVDPDLGWRVYQVGANTLAGTIVAASMSTLSASATVAVLASVMTQASYGFSFTAYDPYAADPLVFVIAALLAWCWVTDRLWLAVALSAIGVFAKETVALVAGAIAIAALVERFAMARGHAGDRGWWRWLMPAIASALVLGTFHVISRVWLGWEIASNPAAQLSHGSWLGLWWRNNPFIERKLYMIFATFGFGWLLAACGWAIAPPRWRALAIGTIPPLLLLIVGQTPERAIGNAFFVVVPLAVLFATRSPIAGSLTIALNALITAKAGTSAALLPSARWLLIPAAITTAITIAAAYKNKGTPESGDASL